MTLLSKGLDPRPEIMVPLVGSVTEFTHQKKIIENVAQQVFQEHGKRVQYKIGTMVTTTPCPSLIIIIIAYGSISSLILYFTYLTHVYDVQIEVPRAALVAGELAKHGAEFFSYGTNDLTQMTFGFSRDDVGTFLPAYLKAGILDKDPFQVIDEEGVGSLIVRSAKDGKKSAVHGIAKVLLC